MPHPPRQEPRDVAFRRDLISAVLGFAPFYALNALLPFIAVNRFGATMTWVGFLNTGVYIGLLGNSLFAAGTARVNLQRSIATLMAVSAALMAAAAFQRTAAAYCILVVLVMVSYGLINAQYDTFLVRLYDAAERPKRLSLRWLAVSIGAAAMSPLFGRLADGPSGHLPSLLCAAALLLCGALVFRIIPARADRRTDPFSLARMVRVAFQDRRFLRLVALMILYGWLGAGMGTIDVALYRRYALSEFTVGILSGATTVGMIAAALAVTPFLRLRGGLSNFRLCFSAATGAAVFLCTAGIGALGAWGAPAIGAGNFLYGISATGFTLGAQTAAVNLAGDRNVALYVNAFRFVQGIRGILFPVFVAMALQAAPIGVTVAVGFFLTLVCAVVSWIPAADPH
jgi:hypothetical protein